MTHYRAGRYKSAWDRYLQNTNQPLLSSNSSEMGVKRVKSPLRGSLLQRDEVFEDLFYEASVPPSFRMKLTNGDIRLIHASIVDAPLEHGRYHLAACTNVLYLLNQPVVSGLCRLVYAYKEGAEEVSMELAKEAGQLSQRFDRTVSIVAKAVFSKNHPTNSEAERNELFDTPDFREFYLGLLNRVGSPLRIRSAANLTAAYIHYDHKKLKSYKGKIEVLPTIVKIRD